MKQDVITYFSFCSWGTNKYSHEIAIGHKSPGSRQVNKYLEFLSW